MTTKEWLLRAKNIDTEIETLMREKEKLFSRAVHPTLCPEGDKVQTSITNTTESVFAAYADYSALLDKRIDELYEVKCEITKAIGKVEDTIFRALLTMRYIRFMTWEEIALGLGYSYKHTVHILHPKALSEIEKIRG